MKLVRILLKSVLAIVGVIALIVVALVISGRGLVTRPAGHRVRDLVVPPDGSLIARGRHLAEVNCASCHAPDAGDPVLSGGTENFLNVPGGPRLGVLHAPNLTPGGRAGTVSDGQLSRAIREGVGFDDRAMLMMPSAHYRAMSDQDLAAVIAYLRAQPPADHVVPRRRLTALAYLIVGLHQYDTSEQRPVQDAVVAPPEAPDSTYGAYLTPILGCTDCHGPDYRGGHRGQFPPIGPDLVAVTNASPLGDFDRALRHGVGTSGRALDPARMPWPFYSKLTDLEVEAVYRFLRGRPGR